MNSILSKTVMALFAMLLAISTSAANPLIDKNSNATVQSVNCVEQTVWRDKSPNAAAGFVRVKACFVTCSAGSDTKECAKTDKCVCRCLPNGQPECNCHPQGGKLERQVRANESKARSTIDKRMRSAYPGVA